MADLFAVLGWVDVALADPSRTTEALVHIDRSIEATLRVERDEGQRALLLPYGRTRPFLDPRGRSLFVDGEVAMMLAARLHLATDPAMRDELSRRVEVIEASLRAGPKLSGESYPNECWTFCNTTALAALVAADPLLGTDHRGLVDDWVRMAQRDLVDPETGLLVSSYTWDGQVLDGPEGSSIFMVAHNLLLLDPAWGRDQYARAHDALVRDAAGFSWAREWPRDQPWALDIDSGLVVPGLEASPGASGLAVLGAAAFGDVETRDGLLRALHLAAAPTSEGDARWYAAAGRIGNAVLFRALAFGPLWQRISEAAR